MAKKAYVGVPNFEMVSLPEGYTQVEYIESSGTQYIDTGFKPNQNTRVVIDVDMTGSIGLSFPTVFSTDSSGTVGYRFTTMLYAEYDGFHDHYGNQTVNSSNINVYSRYILDKNKNVTYLNGKVVSAFSGVSFQSAVPLLLLASLDAGTYQYFAKAKIYSCKVYDNGTLVRDYIPCTNSSGVAGLYDLVSKEFYVNAGTGAFTTGTSTQNSVAKDVTSMYIGVPRFELVELPEGYTQVEYIKSSIGAYIDTEYKANNNTRVVSDHEFVSGDPYPNLFGAWDKSLTNSFIYVVLADMKTAAPLYGSKQINQVYDCTGRKTIDFNKNIVKLNGNTVATFDSQTFSCSYNMYVFAYNSAGVASNMTEAYVYSFKIYDNENLVRNFIPCVNAAGAAGLYDIVNGKFYGNSGSGILSAGAACKQDTYTQVEYIQSNGTQWINTNHRVSSQNIRYVCKMAYTGDNSDGVSFGGGSTSGYAIALFRNEPAFWVGTSSAICGFAMERGVDYELDISANNGTFVFLKDGADQQTTFYGGTMSSENPISIFAQNVTGTGHQFASIRISYFKIYDNDVLVRDYIPCVNSSGVAGLYDLANRVFYTNAGTGVFAIGENVGEIETGDAEKPVARYVLKGYIGVGNVARPFWSPAVAKNTLSYYGAITSMSSALMEYAGASVGEYALFCCGNTGSSTYSSNVATYNAALTRGAATAFGTAVFRLAGTSVGDYAIFGGGTNGTHQKNVVAYSSSLVKKTATSLPSGKTELTATSNGSHAVFAGGYSGSTPQGTVHSYDTSLTMTTRSILSKAVRNLASTSLGEYALIAGGMMSGNTSNTFVDAYNGSMTKTNSAHLSVGRCYLSAASNKKYALFGGGTTSASTVPSMSYVSKVVDVYDASLTRVSLVELSAGRVRMSANNIGDYILFAGGTLGLDGSTSAGVNTVDVFDSSLTRTATNGLSERRSDLASAMAGDYLVFGGGCGDLGSWLQVSNMTAAVDAYTLI